MGVSDDTVFRVEKGERNLPGKALELLGQLQLSLAMEEHEPLAGKLAKKNRETVAALMLVQSRKLGRQAAKLEDQLQSCLHKYHALLRKHAVALSLLKRLKKAPGNEQARLFLEVLKDKSLREAEAMAFEAIAGKRMRIACCKFQQQWLENEAAKMTVDAYKGNRIGPLIKRQVSKAAIGR